MLGFVRRVRWVGVLRYRYGYEELLGNTPEVPKSACPPATAVIVAYLPNEAEIIMATLLRFKEHKYPAPLQASTPAPRGNV